MQIFPINTFLFSENIFCKHSQASIHLVSNTFFFFFLLRQVGIATGHRTGPASRRDREAIDAVAGHVAGLRVALPVVERHAAVRDLGRAVCTGQGAELAGDAGPGRRLTRRCQRRPGSGAAAGARRRRRAVARVGIERHAVGPGQDHSEAR